MDGNLRSKQPCEKFQVTQRDMVRVMLAVSLKDEIRNQDGADESLSIG